MNVSYAGEARGSALEVVGKIEPSASCIACLELPTTIRAMGLYLIPLIRTYGDIGKLTEMYERYLRR